MPTITTQLPEGAIILNGDELLGILRFYRDHREINEATLSVAMPGILESAHDVELDMSPADLIYEACIIWFEIEE